MEEVSWDEAIEYYRKLTTMHQNEGLLSDGWEWRLPTEAEWEFAARAGSTGARYGELDVIGWYDGNSGGATHTVKQKQANAWGLYDMLGNVSEWCSDWHGEYASGNVTDPRGPSWGDCRVVRGGAWSGDAVLSRAGCRGGCDPDLWDYSLGFRPALSSVR